MLSEPNIKCVMDLHKRFGDRGTVGRSGQRHRGICVFCSIHIGKIAKRLLRTGKHRRRISFCHEQCRVGRRLSDSECISSHGHHRTDRLDLRCIGRIGQSFDRRHRSQSNHGEYHCHWVHRLLHRNSSSQPYGASGRSTSDLRPEQFSSSSEG